MSQNPEYTPPPIPQSGDPAQASTVRRHHTIASSSGRMGPRIAERRDSEEAAAEEDETDDQWTGGAAMSSEKQASLQRNLSLPSKYHRPTRDQPSMQTGTLTPSKSMGGLSSLDAGPEDEEWSGVAATMYDEDETDQIATSQTHPENLYQASPAATGAVRRHVSMTDGQRTRKEPGLQRHPTMSGKPPMRSSTMNATTEAADDEYTAAYEDAEEDTTYPPESAYGGIQQTTWDQPTPNEQTWRADHQQANIDDVVNNLSNLDIQRQGPNYARGGPRFEPNAPSGYPDYVQQLQQRNIMNQAQRVAVNTEVHTPSGPASASAYIPTPGHNSYHSNRESMGSGDDHHRSASGSEWDRKGSMLKGRGSNPNIGQGYQSQYGGGGSGFGNMPPPPPIPAQYLNQGQGAGRLGGGNMPLGMGGYGPAGGTGQAFGPIGGGGLMGQPQPGLQQQPPTLDPAAILSSPIDVPSMIAQKGYNPANFDTRPPFARYFVIKSYTEDDVHKSLKYEIWSSTDPGNKRLDKAFKECAGRGPIYLFFSVNASGHFCGMAEMLTSVDYTRSSTVWASDKWKGVFKVRWIFVRDIPNAVLRNIRLNNTQERKPVTNSRDTQELLPEAGHEMLRIFFTHPAKTSLLQDFAFYELQSLQKQQQATMPSIPPAGSPPPPIHGLPGGQGGQHTYGMSYNTQQVPQSPPQAMSNAFNHLNMPNAGNSHYVGPIGMGIGQQVAQSVLRGSSPGPIGSGFPGAGGHVGYQGTNTNNGPGGMSANAGSAGNVTF